jgi:hypothetical protein
VNTDIIIGFQFDYVLPEGFKLYPEVIVERSRLSGYIVTAKEVSANTYRVVAFSFGSATVAPGTVVLLSLPVFIEPDVSNGAYPIAFTGIPF